MRELEDICIIILLTSSPYRSCCTLDHSVLMIHAAQVQIRGALDAVAKYVDPLSSDVLQTKYSPRQAFIHHPRVAKAPVEKGAVFLSVKQPDINPVVQRDKSPVRPVAQRESRLDIRTSS